MKKYAKYAILFLLVLTVFWPSPAYAKGLFDDKVVFGGTFTLESGESLDGSLVIFGGAVTTETDSTVNGDIVLLGGVAEINGTVNGNFVGIGGAVQLTDTAVVNGDLVTIGATLNRDEGANVNGDIVDGMGIPFVFEVPSNPQASTVPELPEIPSAPLAPGLFWNFNPILDMMWFFFRTFMFALLAVLVVIFFDKSTGRVAKAAVDQPITTGGAGFLTAVLAPMALIAMTLTIILIPVTIFTVLALVVAWLFGWISVGLEVGRRISKLFNVEWAPAVSAGVGTFILSLVLGGFSELIPCVGWLPQFLVGLWGLGAVIMTRFGTQEYTPASGSAATPEAAGSELPETIAPDMEGSSNPVIESMPVIEVDCKPETPTDELSSEADAGASELVDPKSDK